MELENSAIDDSCKSFIKYPKPSQLFDLYLFIHKSKEHIKEVLNKEAQSCNIHTGIKYHLSLKVRLKKYIYDNDQEQVKHIEPFFNSTTRRYMNNHESLTDAQSEMINHFECYIHQDSGWILDTIQFLRMKVFKYKLYSGGNSAHTLPTIITKTKACRNVICKDDRCFLYCCLASFHNILNRKPYVFQRFKSSINTGGMSFPMTIKQIPQFERNNPI